MLKTGISCTKKGSVTMTVITSEFSISKTVLRALIELTGQPQLDVAIPMALRDAVEHRLQQIEATIQTYEDKYGLSFSEFEARGRDGTLPDRFSYEVEHDYFEWDSLVTRRARLQEIRQWLS